ncbi:hypothetical protein V9L82_000550 [Salmonella enterica subsp. enterica serovar Braenderup]|nr:hypothetical protein [Salmonella enterica]EBV2051982.1 hypothetical protein [Salmonella enterica subsp. enterica serovar Braenderup]ECD1495948.1 hypothetical protein [Salmonella enterica subsp. enterica serovar Braenderup]EDE5503657.1 hypothetical protein [Salmonella enterica subsp. enterica serovar Braenderup]EDI0091210.1 hypothetical protein [Salmonella enterica subsp. enterica serovar Manhattan]
MNKRTQIIQFRADEETYRRAQKRVKDGGLQLPDVMRAALRSVADADVSCLADLINGTALGSEEINQAWLFQKCHELFEYRDGQLFRKSRKGMGEQGNPVFIRVREGEEHVLIQGSHYPLKDIVWLMVNGSITGEVEYKNPYRVNAKHSIENLMINPVKEKETILVKYLNRSERIDVIKVKQRAFMFDTSNDENAKNVIEKLINSKKTIPLLLRGDDGWIASRTAIHAFKLVDNQYVVSIS